ncbi:MAG: ATP-binding protein, partial [Stellaceae bacterium]
MSARRKPGRAAADCLAGGGEMGALMRATDWAKTPIGPVETWPQSLRMMVSFLLANRFPLLLWWGPQFCQLYNDPYRPVLGTKHPCSLGQPASECWAEIWHVIGPLIETPFTGGPATWSEDIFLELNRHGFVEETHFTIAYSPVPDESAPRGIGGVLATVHEITEKVVGERRVLALRDLGARATEARTAEDACALAAATLAPYAQDVPFALLYLIDADGRQARLAGTAGIGRGEAVSPLVVDLQVASAQKGWPLAQAARAQQIVVIEDLESRFRHLPQGPWSDPPRSAVVAPIRATKAGELAGLLVAAVSPRLRFDDSYRGFFELMASQIATAIANARAYEEERKRAEALAAIDRAKTAFFSNVSHEFRTPLTLMLGPLEDALALPAEGLPTRRDDLELVHRNGLRLLRLVNTLLDFSRIEAARVEASYEPLDLAAATADLASVFRAATDRAGLVLTVECPPLGAPVWVDRDMWEKIVLNLLSNAFKFTMEGGITVRLRRDGERAVLSVADTGTGIPAHEIPRLFERFHRVAGAEGRTHEGTGIGLALVQELARLHGGAVQVESTPGRGSAFSVTIPLGTAHLPPERLRAARTCAATGLGAQPFVEEALRWLPEAAGSAGPGIDPDLLPAPHPPAPAAAEGERATLLIADDNADMRAYLRRLLGTRYRVRAAADGAEALTALRAAPPDLLLSDIMMPRMDGCALLRAVRADPVLAELPVILLSARAGEDESVEGLNAGADDYLVKPFSARELLARVAANLEMARLRRTMRQSLHQASEETAAILESIDDAFFAVDGDWRLIFINHHTEAFWGKRREEVLGRPLLELFPHAAGTPLYEAMQEAMRERRAVSCEALSVAVARGRWVRGTFYPYRTGISVYLRDITEQKQAQEALRASEARLRLATDAAEVGFWDVDPVNDVLVWPPIVKAMFGIPPEAPVSMAQDFYPRLHPDDRERVSAAFAAACDPEQRALYDVEYRTIGQEDGVVRWVAAKGRALFDPQGRCIRVLGTAIAITGRKQAEEALRESEARLSAELAAMQQLQAISTQLIHDQGANALYEKLVEAAAVIMRSDFATMQVLHPERGSRGELRLLASHGLDAESVKFWEWVRADSGCTCGMVLHTGRRAIASNVETCDFMAGTPDRTAYLQAGIHAAQSTPLISRSGRLLGMISTHWRAPHEPPKADLRRLDVLARLAADLLERAQAETALRKLNERLERTVEERSHALEVEIAERQKIEAALHQSQRLEAIGRLTGGIAHDFNNLLTVILGQAEAIAETAEDNPRIARMADAAIRAAERGAQLTGQLLSFAGRQQLRPAAIAVDRLIGGIGDFLRRAVGETIAVDIAADPALWPSFIDPAQFEAAILNLVINARDAMPQGGRLSITLRNAVVAREEAGRLDLKPGEYVVASVADTGVGMTPEVRRRAFEPFFTTKDIGKG